MWVYQFQVHAPKHMPPLTVLYVAPIWKIDTGIWILTDAVGPEGLEHNAALLVLFVPTHIVIY